MAIHLNGRCTEPRGATGNPSPSIRAIGAHARAGEADSVRHLTVLRLASALLPVKSGRRFCTISQSGFGKTRRDRDFSSAACGTDAISRVCEPGLHNEVGHGRALATGSLDQCAARTGFIADILAGRG